jgi:thymidylate synthase (FAD)
MAEKKINLYGSDKCFVELVEHMGSDLSVVNSARVSFGKHKDVLDLKDEKLIKYLIKHKHTSTLEHCIVTFRLKVPLFVRSQHHRHRTWSYNEISRRYTDFDIQFYEPEAFRTQHKSNRQASNADKLIDPEVGDYFYDDNFIFKCVPCEDEDMHCLVEAYHKMSLDVFNMMINKGVCREQARGVLPQNMLTEYYATVNLNNLFKFIILRTHEGAQVEIQEVARAMLAIIEELYPKTVKYFKESQGELH